MIDDADLARLLVSAALQLGEAASREIDAAIRRTRPELLKDDPGPLDVVDTAREKAVGRVGVVKP